MRLACVTPAAADLSDLGAELASWQADPWPGTLHPGDLGWYSLRGPAATAAAMRVWTADDRPVLIGLFDDGVLRLGWCPDLAGDLDLAHVVAHDLSAHGSTLVTSGPTIVELRGCEPLRAGLHARGWVDDEAWTVLVREFPAQGHDPGIQVTRLGPGADAALVEAWVNVHRSAFRGESMTDANHAAFVARWRTMMTGPLADRARCLLAHDGDGAPVAGAIVWSAGRGRPGIIEPLAVHRDHQGRGFGAAMTRAAATALHDVGASSAGVATPGSYTGAIATYRAAGFAEVGSVPDLRAPWIADA